MATSEGTGEANQATSDGGLTSDLTGDSGMTTEAGLIGGSGGGVGGVTGDAGGAGLGTDTLAGAGGGMLDVGTMGSPPTTGGLDDSTVRKTLDDALQDIDTLRRIGGDPGDASTTIR